MAFASQYSSKQIKLAALILRRTPKSEKQIYHQIIPYQATDYEVLLRYWPAEPYLNSLAAFSGPAYSNPEIILVENCRDWSEKLAETAGHPNHTGIKGLKAVFLTVTGGSGNIEIGSDNEAPSVFISYIIPVTNERSSVVSCYPADSTLFPKFHSLEKVLHDMYDNSISLHPATREMLAALDNWLREQHTQPNALNNLYSLSLEQRTISSITNPIYGPSVSSDLYIRSKKFSEEIPVDKYVSNPFFGSGLTYKDKPDVHIVNKYFGLGVPDYQVIGTKIPQWKADIPDGDIDWLDKYPLHVFACEGDVRGIKNSILTGQDPNELDIDGWSPLHYACWYGELDVVKSLVEDCLAYIGIQNSNGSTPLHLAAGNGHRDIVAYLLQHPAINAGALDEEGKSPLAVCLENKSNDWRDTEQLLRTAYQEQVDTHNKQLKKPIVMIPLIAHDDKDVPTVDDNQLDDYDLDQRGSQADITKDTSVKSKPVSITKMSINFMNGQHQLAHFYKGNNTSALDVLQELCGLIHLDLEFQFVFALWIVSKSLALQLGDTDKPLKLIGKWKQLMKRFSGGNPSETPSLFMRRNVFFAGIRENIISNSTALSYLYYDAQNHVLSGCYPTSEEEALELASITMQLSYGDYNEIIHNDQFIKDRLPTLLPSTMLRSKKRLQYEKRLLVKHELLSQRQDNTIMLYDKYLELCRRWPFYGATFYEGNLTTKIYQQTTTTSSIKSVRKLPIRIGINTLGFHIVNKETNVLIQSHTLDGMEWDMSEEKHLFCLKTLNGDLSMTIHTKQAPLLHSLSTQMKKELDSVKISFNKQQLENKT